MSTGIFSIGITGMNAAQLGLVTTEHNIANATTPGYNRQRIIQGSNIPLMTGAGAVGQGTHVSTIERMYSTFLTGQVNRSQSNVSELQSYYAEISQIDNMLADANSGLSPALQDFFKSVQQMSASPSSLPTRQGVVSSAEAMVSRLHGLENRLSELAESVNGQMTSVVGTINSYAQQVASLNQRIVIAQSSSGQPANDLLDARDQLINELNKLIKVEVNEDPSGAYNVFIGTGQQLVVGAQATQLVSLASEADPERMVIGLRTVGGATQELPENVIVGGELGGLVRFRNESLDPAFNQLGRVTASMALTFNAQHALGQDLQGNVTGDANFVGDFFTLSAPRVVGNARNDPASPVVSASFTAPAHNGENFYTDLTDSDYQLNFDGANFTLTRLSDNKTWTDVDIAGINGQLATDPQGFTLSATAGAFAAYDSFLIQPTRLATRDVAVDARIASDPRLLAAAAPTRVSAGVGNAGRMTIGQGSVSTGYSLANLPVNLTASGADLSGFPVGLTVTAQYSDGTSQAFAAGSVDLLAGTATLKSISFDGMSFDVTGSPAVGDTFILGRNTSANGVSDGRNVLLLGKLQQQKTVSGGTANYQASYAQLVSDNGNRTREAEVTLDAQQALLEQAQSAREALSGVNLDEEAANLIRYQQAYQASAKMLEIGSRLFDTLLSIAN